MNAPSLWLSEAEVDQLCDGLTYNATKVRHLRSLGLTVNEKPNGRPLVVRSHAEAVLSGAPTAAANDTPKPGEKRMPNRDALVLAFGRNR